MKQEERPSDILRTIEHRYGTFRAVKDGLVTGDYRIVELRDGRLFYEFTDGKRKPFDSSRHMMEARIAEGEWREVKP